MIDDGFDYWDFDPDPDRGWARILALIENAETAEEYGFIAALPLHYFWAGWQTQYRAAAVAVAPRLPQLPNLLIAKHRHFQYAMHVMDLLEDPNPRSRPFAYEPPRELAEMATPGAHPLTEGLRLPNPYVGRFREETPPPTEDEQRQLVESYFEDPEAWEEELGYLMTHHPRLGWQLIRELCARPAVWRHVGKGPLGELVTYAEDVVRDDVLAVAGTRDPVAAALAYADLSSLSDDFLDALAARLTSSPLRPKFTT